MGYTHKNPKNSLWKAFLLSAAWVAVMVFLMLTFNSAKNEGQDIRLSGKPSDYYAPPP